LDSTGFLQTYLDNGKDILQRDSDLFTKLVKNSFHSQFNRGPMLPDTVMNLLRDSFPLCFLGQEQSKGNIPKLIPCFPQFFLRMAMFHFFKLQ